MTVAISGIVLQSLLLLLSCFMSRALYVLTRIWLHRLQLLPYAVTDQSSLSSDNYTAAAAVRTLIVLGSGGHTGEMMTVLQSILKPSAAAAATEQQLQHQFSPITFIAADNDVGSIRRVKDTFYSSEATATATTAVNFLTIARSRAVGQSYLSSIPSTIRALTHSITIAYRTAPQLVIVNGPGTCVPICYCVLLLQLLLLRRCQICYLESYCRVQSLSFTGLLLWPIATRFVVQWPQLQQSRIMKATTTLAQNIL